MPESDNHTCSGNVLWLDALDDLRVSPELADIVRARVRVQDRAATAVERELRRTIRNLQTAIGATYPGRTVTDDIRRSILATQLRDVRDLLDDAGLASARASFFGRFDDIDDLAAETLESAGVDEADRILDEPATRLGIDAAEGRQLRAWEDAIERPMSRRILDGLQTSLTGESLDSVIARIQEAEGRSVGSATTEARTMIAEYDRSVQEEATQGAERDGFELVRVYLGPEDKITRPFCRELVGKAFDRSEIAALNNSQTSVAPLFSGGGFNCRHSFVAMSAGAVRDSGVTLGTMADIQAANAAAKARR